MRELRIWEDAFDRVLVRLELAARGSPLEGAEAEGLADMLHTAWWRPGEPVRDRALMMAPPMWSRRTDAPGGSDPPGT